MKTYSFEEATGTIEYGFTNDYMFRAILQKNKKVLKALICALLHFEPDAVRSVEVTNPIELGESMEDKDFVLDIHVSLNDNTNIDLEMQVRKQIDWEERSLSYLCRTFDQLVEGENYGKANVAIHIGFLDFTPFPDCPEFYAIHKLMNVKNHRIYSDKFILSMVDLTRIDLATDEDKSYQIDHWARLFKARTWEELKMIAEKNENLQEASENLYKLNLDDIARQKARARAHYEYVERTAERLTKENAILAEKNEALSSENEALKKLLDKHGISF